MNQKPFSCIESQFFTPIFASLVKDRLTARLLGGVGVLQLVLNQLDLLGWQCPIKATFGLPCPGCGLTRSMLLLLRGKWREALIGHVFSPIFLVGIVLMLLITVFPESLHQRTVRWIADLERRTGFGAFMLLGLIVYWGVRVIGFLGI